MTDNNTNQREREVAHRVLAGELEISDQEYRDGDGEKAPKYLVTPTGVHANRLLIAGSAFNKEDRGNEKEFWRLNISDSSSTYLVYAGEQYQAEAAEFIRELDTPEYVAVVGKPRTYENDEGDVITSLRPEHIRQISGEERDYYILQAVEQTIERMENETLKSLGLDHYSEEDQEHVKQEVIDVLSEIRD